MHRKRVMMAFAFLVLTLLGAAVFLGVRLWLGTEGPQVTAQQGQPDLPPTPTWFEEFENKSQTPQIKRQQVGVWTVGTDVTYPDAPPCDGEYRRMTLVSALEEHPDLTSHPLWPHAQLPDGLKLEKTQSEAVFCEDGQLINLKVEYNVPAKEDAQGNTVWNGGILSIFRVRFADPNQRRWPLHAREGSLEALQIANRQAVIEHSIKPKGLDVGIDDTVLLISEDWGMTMVDGLGLPEGLVIAIAKSLYAGGGAS